MSIGGFIFGFDTGSVLFFIFVAPLQPSSSSSVNGVKDMKGYRETLNIPYIPPGANNSNETGSCNSDDDVETAAILVITFQTP